jgi:4-diphosphocytidyl-2C-methyl-D-erythritol kinase
MAEPGIARRTSEHFASEFGSGLSCRQLLERAAVLASANDLAPAAAVVVPGLVPFRRALTRLIGRPIGLSGSGPTVWALYASRAQADAAAVAVSEALDAGTLSGPAGDRPHVTATTMLTRAPESTPDQERSQ